MLLFVVDELLREIFPDGHAPTSIEPSRLPLYIWVTKALVLRNHTLSRQFLLQVSILQFTPLPPLHIFQFPYSSSICFKGQEYNVTFE